MLLLRRVVHNAPRSGHSTHPHRRAAHHRRQADVATTHDGGVHTFRTHDCKDMALEVVDLQEILSTIKWGIHLLYDR